MEFALFVHSGAQPLASSQWPQAWTGLEGAGASQAEGVSSWS